MSTRCLRGDRVNTELKLGADGKRKKLAMYLTTENNISQSVLSLRNCLPSLVYSEITENHHLATEHEIQNTEHEIQNTSKTSQDIHINIYHPVLHVV